jgi:hypothetical protein
VTRDPRWNSYSETILEIGDPQNPIRVDLRRPLNRAGLDALRALPIGIPFGVVTAADPVGRQLSDADNRVRYEVWRERIESSGLCHIRADGFSPDSSHHEAGSAIHALRAEIHRLAREFEQSAFFWFDGDAFWLVDATDDSHEVRLPPDEK